MIEAMTGTVWNLGYESIDGYDAGAGGRTGSIGTGLDSFIPGTPAPPPGPTDAVTGATATPPYRFAPDQFPNATPIRGQADFVVRNVRNIGVNLDEQGEEISLENFVRVHLFGAQ
jgi:hypothetical protein